MHFRIGYFLVCCTPIIDWALWVPLSVICTMLNVPRSLEGDLANQTWINILVISIQFLGLLLFMLRFKTETIKTPFVRFFSGLLLFWGLITSVLAVFFYYYELLPWSLEFGTRTLTIWDHGVFATSLLKGLLWVVSGSLFAYASYVHWRSRSANLR